MVENLELWERYKNKGDMDARQELVLEYMYLVKYIVSQLYNKYDGLVEYEDLLSYGYEGLLDALDRFDLEQGTKFSTYANFRVKGSIIDVLRKLDWIPRGVRSKTKQYDAAVSKLIQIKGPNYTREDLAKELDTDLEGLIAFEKYISTYSLTSMDDHIENDFSFGIPSNYNNPEETVLNQLEVDNLAEQVEKLDDRSRKLIELYFYSELTIKETALVVGLSGGRVSQILTETLSKLRVLMR